MELNPIDYLLIVAYIILLIVSIYMLISFYICDGHQCKIFVDAEKVGPENSLPYTKTLVENTFHDGAWPISYIGASIATLLIIWLLGLSAAPTNFGLIFLMIFLTVYSLISFLGHHYIRPISMTVLEYLQTNSMLMPTLVDMVTTGPIISTDAASTDMVASTEPVSTDTVTEAIKQIPSLITINDSPKWNTVDNSSQDSICFRTFDDHGLVDS